jgi:membrane protein insertase Oxa1/YidC/SpoIIIJ
MLLQLPLIFGLWNVIRQPLSYICNFSDANLYNSVKVMVESGVNNPTVNKLTELFSKYITDGKLAEYSEELQKQLDFNQIYIADALNTNRDTIDGLNDAIQQKFVIETEFMGINLGETASAHGLWSWFILIPIIAALSSFLVSFLSMRMNRRQPESDDPTAKSMNMMMYTMPLLSLWIGYTMNFGVAIYWVCSNIFSLVQTILLPKFLKEKTEIYGQYEKNGKLCNSDLLKHMGLVEKETQVKPTKRVNKITSKPVIQYTIDGEFVKEWESIYTASESISGVKGSYGNIYSVCKGKTKTAYGFVWKYKSDC